MDSKQRILAALRRAELDRLPVVPHGYAEPFLRRYFDPSFGGDDPGQAPAYNPNLNLVEAQLAAHGRFGFDPIIWMTFREPPCEWASWADDWVIHKWENVPCDSWVIHEQLLAESGGNRKFEYLVETPEGELKCVIEHEPGHTRWILANPIKEENDINLLRFRPEPGRLDFVRAVNAQLQTIGKQGVGIVHVPGVWHQACDLRGIHQLSYDLYDRTEWVERFFGLLRDYLLEFIKVLSTSNLEVLILNESHLGLGVSPRMFHRFIYQHDKMLIEAAKENGLITIYHNCGRSDALLEGMADTGAHAVETLAPRVVGGDVDLADAKRRIGSLVCLRGGMDTTVIEKGDRGAITAEVKRCLQAAARGGGYILGPVSPIYEAPFENLEHFADVAIKMSSEIALRLP
jgi:uroporphyrinogen-III decarboxylase